MNKRIDYINWDTLFMSLAILTAKRSKDPSTQVGACIVSQDNKVLSLGYNGAPIGFNDDDFPWGREGNPIDTKYMYVAHAELNAILNYKGNLDGTKIYVDLFPCNECAKAIVQAGIKEVIFKSDKYKNTDNTIVAKKIFDKCGVTYRKIEIDEKNEEIVINLKEI